VSLRRCGTQEANNGNEGDEADEGNRLDHHAVLLVYSGVESNAIEPFALIFSLAVGIGLIAVGLWARCQTISEMGMIRLREQFQFESRAAEHAPLSANNVSALLKEHEQKREEEAVVFGFLLLLVFVHIISPLVVAADHRNPDDGRFENPAHPGVGLRAVRNPA